MFEKFLERQSISNNSNSSNSNESSDKNNKISFQFSQTPQSKYQSDSKQELQFSNLLQIQQLNKLSFISQQIIYNYSVFEPKFTKYSPDDWKSILKLSDKSLISYTELEYNLRNGIPDDLRPKIWFQLSGISKLERKFKGQYNILKNQPSKYDDQINKDINRTLGNHSYFKNDNSSPKQTFNSPQLSSNVSAETMNTNSSRNGSYTSNSDYPNNSQNNSKGQQQLFNLLRAFANFDQELGYVQGMNFLAAHILLNIRAEKYTNFSRSFGSKCDEKSIEEKAFLIFYHIMIEKNWRQTYLSGFVRLHVMIESLRKNIHPELLHHFEEIGLDIFTTFQNFYLSLFLRDVSAEFGRRFIDLFLHRGEPLIETIILRLLDIFYQEILQINDGFTCAAFISQEMFKKAFQANKNDLSILLPLSSSHTRHM